MRSSLIPVVFCVTCTVALAQTYPAKPVRIVVAYPAGGSVDVVARIVGQKFTESMGRSFGQFIKDEIALHQRIVKVSGIKAE